MKLKEKLSVCVVTHIINVDTDPYINNKMINNENNKNMRARGPNKLYYNYKLKNNDKKIGFLLLV